MVQIQERMANRTRTSLQGTKRLGRDKYRSSDERSWGVSLKMDIIVQILDVGFSFLREKNGRFVRGASSLRRAERRQHGQVGMRGQGAVGH